MTVPPYSVIAELLLLPSTLPRFFFFPSISVHELSQQVFLLKSHGESPLGFPTIFFPRSPTPKRLVAEKLLLALKIEGNPNARMRRELAMEERKNGTEL